MCTGILDLRLHLNCQSLIYPVDDYAGPFREAYGKHGNEKRGYSRVLRDKNVYTASFKGTCLRKNIKEAWRILLHIILEIAWVVITMNQQQAEDDETEAHHSQYSGLPGTFLQDTTLMTVSFLLCFTSGEPIRGTRCELILI